MSNLMQVQGKSKGFKLYDSARKMLFVIGLLIILNAIEFLSELYTIDEIPYFFISFWSLFVFTVTNHSTGIIASLIVGAGFIACAIIAKKTKIAMIAALSLYSLDALYIIISFAVLGNVMYQLVLAFTLHVVVIIFMAAALKSSDEFFNASAAPQQNAYNSYTNAGYQQNAYNVQNGAVNTQANAYQAPQYQNPQYANSTVTQVQNPQYGNNQGTQFQNPLYQNAQYQAPMQEQVLESIGCQAKLFTQNYSSKLSYSNATVSFTQSSVILQLQQGPGIGTTLMLGAIVASALSEDPLAFRFAYNEISSFTKKGNVLTVRLYNGSAAQFHFNLTSSKKKFLNAMSKYGFTPTKE